MATLALAAVGSAVGGALLPGSMTLFGATLSGAVLGAQVGALAGSYVDQKLLGSMGGGQSVKGPRLNDLHITASTEGAPVPRIYGRARVGGQLIWADEIEEVAKKQSAGGSGKGGFGGGGAKITTYTYHASFAVAVCEGMINRIGRIWADGKELDLSGIVYRVHKGNETQFPDDLILSRLGTESAPAFRGVAYIVFERISLEQFGNRIPQLSFEVFRDVDDFALDVRGVVMIPGSGEFVYATEPVSRGLMGGTSHSENVHTRLGGSDWMVSLDQLEDSLPQARSVSLVTSWFGTDLRAQHCEIRPGVDTATKATTPLSWSVAGLTRANAYLVSEKDGRAAYGGTPSDQTVVAAIQDLKSRGMAVTLTPFLLMDVPDDNALTSPYDGSAKQPAYPWRGRITCDPAPGVAGSVDKTAAASSQIVSFVGTAVPGDFSISGTAVVYSGPAEWSFRRMILHYATLAKAAGGVDAFVIGTELRGLTQVRDDASRFPFVDALVALAQDVKSVLGPATKVTYAADWSEYFGYHPTDGSGDVYFHLDTLWSSPSIDAIGIDLYWPLADWRDGRSHRDYIAGVRSIYDLDYLSGNVAGGEGFDWYYANVEDREEQVRTPISDGAAGKPWVFRYKDLKSWWSEPHFDRSDGIEAAIPTGWVPQSKPIWFLEVGCPAVDKGANQPNVFVDPKSAETALPYFSRGIRDDFMQRQYIKALTRAFDPASSLYASEANPVSAVYGERMVQLDHAHVYAWDARPYPAFPNDLHVWGDGGNWSLGHWLNGRVSNVPLGAVVRQMMQDYGFAEYTSAELTGSVPGYIIDHVMSLRDALQPLALAYFIDVIESGGRILFRHRASDEPVARFHHDDVVEVDAERPLATFTRGQETELPVAAKLTYIGATDDYRQAVAESRRLAGVSGRVSQAELPIILDEEQAIRIADSWLHETWVARERINVVLPPSRIAIEPSDLFTVMTETGDRTFRVIEVSDSGVRQIEARAVDASIYDAGASARRPRRGGEDVIAGPPLVYFLDLPMLRGDESSEAGYVVARQKPWPGPIAVFRSPEDAGFILQSLIEIPATLGLTETDLAAGPEARVDRSNRLRVAIAGGQLSSVTTLQLLAGQNAAAVRNADGAWEVLQFLRVELVASGVYELSDLLRGQAGTADAMRPAIPAGSPFVLLDSSLVALPQTLADIGLAYSWRYGPASRDIHDRAYAGTMHAFRGIGLRPYAPVHVRGVRHVPALGDLTIKWVRRTRVGGDSWDVVEVPLGEASEAYEVEIVGDGGVKRALRSSTPEVVYSAADQVNDFGTTQPACTVRVYQLSAVYGRGAPQDAII